MSLKLQIRGHHRLSFFSFWTFLNTQTYWKKENFDFFQNDLIWPKLSQKGHLVPIGPL